MANKDELSNKKFEKESVLNVRVEIEKLKEVKQSLLKANKQDSMAYRLLEIAEELMLEEKSSDSFKK